jgi:hypothetical protein
LGCEDEDVEMSMGCGFGVWGSWCEECVFGVEEASIKAMGMSQEWSLEVERHADNTEIFIR